MHSRFKGGMDGERDGKKDRLGQRHEAAQSKQGPLGAVLNFLKHGPM